MEMSVSVSRLMLEAQEVEGEENQDLKVKSMDVTLMLGVHLHSLGIL